MNRNFRVEEVINQFEFSGQLDKYEPYGCGHINDTFIIRMVDKGSGPYILQRINTDVFKKPVQLMENIENVTSFLREKISANGGDHSRETLTVVKTKDSLSYYKDSQDNYWRAYYFIDNTVTYQTVEDPKSLFLAGSAFGKFQNLLSDFPAHVLHESIPNFHNTVIRFDTFKKAVENNDSNRKHLCMPEVSFALSREGMVGTIQNLIDCRELPIRVTHNDTKLNNVLIDEKLKKAICVVDLDTVMPGSLLFDFGDAVRFGASSAAEDEEDLSKVSFNLDYYEKFASGFLSEVKDSITPLELDLLPMGAIIMTFEVGIRFLGDFLNGDKYFKVHKENHNLIRSRTQLKLVSEMEANLDAMRDIVSSCYNKA